MDNELKQALQALTEALNKIVQSPDSAALFLSELNHLKDQLEEAQGAPIPDSEEIRRLRNEINSLSAGISYQALKLATKITNEQRKEGYRTVPMPMKAHTRDMPLRAVTWRCIVCGTEHTRTMYPNRKPKYCPPAVEGEKLSPCQKAAQDEAKRKYREEGPKKPRKHKAQDLPVDDSDIDSWLNNRS